MRRLLLCLPVCLLIASDRPHATSTLPPRAIVSIETSQAPLPSAEEFGALAKSDPLACLHAALRKCKKDHHTIHGIMQKQERLGNTLNAVEQIEFWYRAEPHSVLLAWRSKPAGLADRVLFVEGANDNQMLVHPASALSRAVVGNVASRDPYSREAKQGGRVSVADFGMRKATERLVSSCEAARRADRVQLEYLGQRTIPEVNNRTCHIFRQIMDPPEGTDHMASIEVGIDAETWLQTVSIVHDPVGKLLGAYYFHDLELNPMFIPGQFDKSQLLK